MTRGPLGVADYPLVEKRPELVRTATGKPLSDLTLEAIERGEAGIEDLRITAEAAGRATLGRNFRRAAELVGVPQDVLLATYELLRPGRAGSKADILAAAHRLRTEHGARLVAAFVEEAAEVYERRGLFRHRF